MLEAIGTFGANLRLFFFSRSTGLRDLELSTFRNVHKEENDEIETLWNCFGTAPKWHGNKFNTQSRSKYLVEVNSFFSIFRTVTLDRSYCHKNYYIYIITQFHKIMFMAPKELGILVAILIF